jgi:hypothetical protein
VHENTQLLVQFRDNILAIINHMEGMGGVMAQMPQLPVKLNVDLANNFLPSRPASFMSYGGVVMPPPPQPAINAPGMVPLSGFAPGAASFGPGPPMAPMMGAMQPPPPPPPPHISSGMVAQGHDARGPPQGGLPGVGKGMTVGGAIPMSDIQPGHSGHAPPAPAPTVEQPPLRKLE